MKRRERNIVLGREGERRGRETALCGHSYKGTNRILRTPPSWPHLNQITSQRPHRQILRFRASTHKIWRNTIQSTANDFILLGHLFGIYFKYKIVLHLSNSFPYKINSTPSNFSKLQSRYCKVLTGNHLVYTQLEKWQMRTGLWRERK